MLHDAFLEGLKVGGSGVCLEEVEGLEGGAASNAGCLAGETEEKGGGLAGIPGPEGQGTDGGRAAPVAPRTPALLTRPVPRGYHPRNDRATPIIHVSGRHRR